MIEVLIHNIKIDLNFKDENDRTIKYITQGIHEQLDPLDPDRYRKKLFNTYNKYGQRIWDGRIKICTFNPKKGIYQVPTGLYPDLIDYLTVQKDKTGIEFSVKDQRGPKLTADIPDEITLDGHGLEKTLTLRDYQYEGVKGSLEEQVGIVLNATNSGKCKSGDSLVSTSKGIMSINELIHLTDISSYKDIKEYSYKLDIQLVNRYGNLERPSKIFINGKKSLYKVKSDLGLETINTDNHPLLIVNEEGDFVWKKTGELRAGDKLVINTGNEVYGTNKKLDTLDSYCLGLLVADGYYHKGGLSFTNNEESLINTFNKWAKRETGIMPRMEEKYLKGSYSATACHVKVGKSGSFDSFLNYYGLSRVKSDKKSIPKDILDAPKNIQLAFLSGYYECEMSFELRGGRNNIECTTKSHRLAKQLQLMLLNMGIVVNIKPRKIKGYAYTYYRMTFRAVDSLKLVKLLNFKTEGRNNSKNTLIESMCNRRRNAKGRSVPVGKKLCDTYVNSLPSKVRGKARHKYNIPHTISNLRVQRLLKEYPEGDKQLKQKLLLLSDPRIYYTEITDISYYEDDYTYDFEMPETHSFICDGLINHNSVEAISIFKYLLPKLEEGQHLLFIAPRNSIMNQLLLKFQHYLGEDLIGVWGDGKKDLDHPIVCATIQTIASAIKKPDIKLTSKKDKLLERMATKYVPAILESGSPMANLKLLSLNFKPNYKYEEDDLDLFRELSMTLKTDKDATKCLEGYVKKYKKVMYKKNEKGFKKYDSAIEFLNSVVGVICDEAHFAGADSYWNVFQHLTNARLRIGMTGTLDKTKPIHMQRIKSLLGNPITRVTNDQMIKRGVSAKPHIRMVPVDKPANLEMQIGAIAKQQGIGGGSAADLMMYQIAYKLGVVENEYRNSLIARLADASAKQLDKQAVLLIVNSIEHGENICKELDKLGAEYLFIQGKDDNDTRKEALARVKSGDLKILIGTKIIDTGIDVPNFKVLIMCSSGKSYISLLQRVGRVLRIMPEKKDVIIFDMYDRTTDILFRHAKQRIKYYKEQGFDVK